MLSRHELDFINGTLQLEGKAAVNARHRIKKKLKDFIYLELPLLIDYQRKTSPLVEIGARVIIFPPSPLAETPLDITDSQVKNESSCAIIPDASYSEVEVGGSNEIMANVALVETTIDIDWDDFRRYVESQHRPNTSLQIMRYSMKYHHLISTPEGPQRLMELQQLSQGKRKEVMAALANLARYLGLYEGWIDLRKKHGLKWTTFNPEAQAAVFKEMFYNQDRGITSMLEWLKQARKRLSVEYRAYVDFLVLTGLRPDEGCHSIEIMVKEGYENYLNKDRMMLEHFQFPAIFIRRTKKAYVSVATDKLLETVETIRNGKIKLPGNYYDMWDRIDQNQKDNSPKLQRMNMPMNNCRKIYGTWMRMNGIETEFINLLQGRLPMEVFAKHYFRPDFNEVCGKVRKLTEQLYEKIN